MKPIIKSVLGALFIVAGVIMFKEYPFPSTLLIIAGVMIIPYTLSVLERMTKRKLTPWQYRVMFIVLGFFFLAGLGAANDRKTNTVNAADTAVVEYEARPRDLAAERKAMIEAKAESNSGENFMLSEYIKNTLDDPDSYQHDNTKWLDWEGKVIAYVTFRANNRFGAKIKTTYEVVMTDDDKVVSMKPVE
jgi:hypothetical protein